jgi:hypothetical protein
VFLISAVVGGESASITSSFALGEGTPSIDGTGMEYMERLPCPYRVSKSDPSAVQPVTSHYTD